MNTIAHIAAMVALLWASLSYAMNTLDEPQLGFAILAIFVLFIPLTIQALMDDIGGFMDRVKGKKGRDG